MAVVVFLAGPVDVSNYEGCPWLDESTRMMLAGIRCAEGLDASAVHQEARTRLEGTRWGDLSLRQVLACPPVMDFVLAVVDGRGGVVCQVQDHLA